MKAKIAVLASGGGTTAEAVIRATATGHLDATVSLIIVSRQDAGIFDRMHALQKELGIAIPLQLISNKTHPAVTGEQLLPGAQTKAEEAAIDASLSEGEFDLIVLLGYMKRVGPTLVSHFGWRPAYTSPYQATMLNTHPGLLPETKGFYGIHVQQHVLDRHLPFSGQTLHVVAENYDEGPTIAEHRVAVEAGDTAERLFSRVQAAEKRYLAGDISMFLKARQTYLQPQLEVA